MARASFRVGGPDENPPDSPVTLFRDLKKDPTIKFLWGHQERILEKYRKEHEDTRRLAIELPTGAGKTLVGLLIADYQRRKNDLRAAFLCPTKQLAEQVAGQAKKYGIPTTLLIGKQRDWPQSEFAKYQLGEATAITTYSAVFNVNPRISDPQCVICDDAHAADGYIGSLWTVRCDAYEYPEQLKAIYDALGEAVPSEIARLRRKGDLRPDELFRVELASSIAVRDIAPHLADAIDHALKDTDLSYSWSMISEHVENCLFLCSPDSIEIRPPIYPTETHVPFSGARQRIFMSATLGEDGDLERAIGVPNIERLPVPEEWKKRNTGRRLILFPGLSLEQTEEQLSCLAEMLHLAGRGIVLTPSYRLASQIEEVLKAKGNPLLDNSDLVKSLREFSTTTGGTALVVANRYDGIDLPGDACHLEAVVDMPTGASLFERFLVRTLGASSVVRDRVRTRLTQALGRCTREEGDYSLVVLLGRELEQWTFTNCNVEGMHPEIQAELSFGHKNSTGHTAQEFTDLARVFLEQGDEWDGAERDIRRLRDSKETKKDKLADVLAAAVKYELGFMERLWKRQYNLALESAIAAAEKLAGDEAKPYRAYWYYQAAVAAFMASKEDEDNILLSKCRDLLVRASGASYGMGWLGRLGRYVQDDSNELDVTSDIGIWFRSIKQLLTEWGFNGGRFGANVAKYKELIASDESKDFEQGLEVLGRMLGARVKRWKDQSAPDGLWVFSERDAILFEAKTDESSDGVVSFDTMRQVSIHPQRAGMDNEVDDSHQMTLCVVSDRKKIDQRAQNLVPTCIVVTHARVMQLFDLAVSALTGVRVAGQEHSDEELLEYAYRKYTDVGIGPDLNITELLGGTVASELEAVSQ